MCNNLDKSLARLWSVPAVTAPVGVMALLGGVVVVCRHLPPSHLTGCLWTTAYVQIRIGDGGVLDVVPLLGALLWEIWLGGPSWCFFGARRGSRLFAKGPIDVIVGESKMMTFSGSPSPAKPPIYQLF